MGTSPRHRPRQPRRRRADAALHHLRKAPPLPGCLGRRKRARELAAFALLGAPADQVLVALGHILNADRLSSFARPEGRTTVGDDLAAVQRNPTVGILTRDVRTFHSDEMIGSGVFVVVIIDAVICPIDPDLHSLVTNANGVDISDLAPSFARRPNAERHQNLVSGSKSARGSSASGPPCPPRASPRPPACPRPPGIGTSKGLRFGSPERASRSQSRLSRNRHQRGHTRRWPCLACPRPSPSTLDSGCQSSCTVGFLEPWLPGRASP